jgi:hypothetical protein
MIIYNLTQHKATPAQVEAGVVDLDADLASILTFKGIPSILDMNARALSLFDILPEGATHVMIGGAPFFMPVLERVLLWEGLNVGYAFTKRISQESEGVKTSVFVHEGFYWAE